jgi:Ca-activated chloride channel family protein
VAGLLWSSAPTQACFMRSLQPVHVWLDHIDVTIKDQVAVKKYDCTFRNPNPVVVTGATCFMELEPGAHVDNMKVLVDGKEYQAEILDVKKAKEVFNDIVKRGGSPALLEYYGNQLIQTQIPQIPANGTVKVELTYTAVLENRGGLVRLQMLNTNPKASMQPLQSASVKVKITSKVPIKNVYSPTHQIKIEEVPDADVAISWAQENYLPRHPFVLYYQVADDEVGASILAHREPGEEGYFMMMLSPTVGKGAGAITEDKILPKDVVFCVDCSGSMIEGGKMEQAKKALKYCIENLRPNDRFNIVDFSTGVRTFKEGTLVSVTSDTKEQALRYADKLAARGGTAIQEALETSLGLLGESDRLKMVVFTTDGFPTIGEREPDAILKAVSKANKTGARLFVIGEGFDVNTKLLDFLALNNRGEPDYVLPEEDIGKKVAAFYDRVGAPVMTDLKVTIEGIEVKDMHPRQVADVFRGEQVLLYGRYDGAGKKKVKLTANVGGETKSFEYDVEFPEHSENDKNAFVPRLWAGKKVDFLLNELRKGGTEDKELIDEIVFLAKKHGIVTPYTSFLMAEDIVTQGYGAPAQTAALMGKLRANALPAGAAAPMADKAERVKESVAQNKARKDGDRSGGFDALYLQFEDELRREGKGGSALTAIRYINSRTFYRQGNKWQDSDFDAQKVKNLRRVKVRSDEYFKLIDAEPRLAQYVALGNVVVNYKNEWYEFVEEGAE